MLKKIVYSVGNLTGIALFTFLCAAAFQNYQKTDSLFSFIIVFMNGLILMLYFVRREPNALIEFPFAWLISIIATLLPFLLRPIQEAFLPEILSVGYYLQIIGVAAIIGSLLSIRESLGIVPANRGIKIGGFYQIVRHPHLCLRAVFFQWLCHVQSKYLKFLFTVNGIRNAILQKQDRGEFFNQ